MIFVLMFGLSGLSVVQAAEYADLEFESKLITVDNPMDPKYANAGENLRNGVGSIFVEFVETSPCGFLCTAAAISPTHILTAAHCVIEEDFTVSGILFVLNAGLSSPIILEASGFAVHPWYPLFLSFGYGAFAHGDIAVIKLPDPLPGDIEFYGLYRDFDELGQESRHYGHGRSGTGNKGDTSGSPVVNSAGQIVGQLSGACGTNLGDNCDTVNNATVDGAFAAYFGDVEQFLDPGPGGCTVTENPEASCFDGQDNDCDGDTDGDDLDCATGGLPKGAACVVDSDCASNSCKGKPGSKTCK